MPYCRKCGKEISDDALYCPHCGAQQKVEVVGAKNSVDIDDDLTDKLVRFLLTFLLNFIGSIIINHTYLKPQGWKSRSLAYFFLSIITIGVYGIVASICNLTFEPNEKRNIGYFKE